MIKFNCFYFSTFSISFQQNVIREYSYIKALVYVYVSIDFRYNLLRYLTTINKSEKIFFQYENILIKTCCTHKEIAKFRLICSVKDIL